MNRAQFIECIVDTEANEPDPALRLKLIILAADEYAAHLAEQVARSPRYSQQDREAS